ncbi:MAG: serine/threonine protein kinase [Kiritimatiellales bacterium]|nr:serine/threonine protein kinase [Kiritimatiellales bacterium]
MRMEDDVTNDLEKSFRERNETLRGFYHADTQSLSDEEIASLTPILNSLKDNDTRYQELDKIAEGGEKKITLVHDRRLDRRVAMARAAHAKTAQDQEQFLREARLTANLAHPNIMPVYNMGVDEHDVPFFSMELVPGDSLKAIINKLRAGDSDYKRDYPLTTLLNIFIKICDAIAFAHSHNVLHLDIKPDNIRVGEFGEVLVCDWGLARVVNTPETTRSDGSEILDGDVLNDMTMSGTMKGTPGFMAPEQTHAYGEKTPQTDIYALGAVLYMMLTHELPVDGNSANEVIKNTREGNLVPLRRRKTDQHIPTGLVAVTMKALARDPANRYESVLALSKEINRFLTGYPTEAENAGFVTHLSLLMQRHSRVALLLMSFLLLLAAVISSNLVAINREKSEAVAAREEAENNFLLYLKQQQVAKELGENLDEAVLYTVKSRDFVNAPSMIHVLETGLKAKNIDPISRENLLIQKGTLHFVLQEFNAASECFDAAGDAKRAGQLRSLSNQYAKIKPVDSKRLTDSQLADLFYAAKTAAKPTLYYMYYHHMRRRPASATPEQYLPLASAVLDKLNNVRRPMVRPLKLTKQGKGYHLDLSNSNYTVYSLSIIGVYRKNVLAPLELTSLDVSNSKFDDPAELRGLSLDELRMVGVVFSNKKGLAKQLEPVGLKRLILKVDDFPKAAITELRKTMTVVDARK